MRVHPSPYHGYVGWNILTDGVIIADLIDTKKDRFSVVKVYLNRVDLKMDVSRRKLEQMVRDTGVLITYCVTTYAYADRGCIFLVNENYPFNYHLSGARDSGFFPDKRRNLFTTARALADPCDFYGLRKILNAWYLEASQNPGQSTFMSDVCYKMSCHSFSCWASPRYKIYNYAIILNLFSHSTFQFQIQVSQMQRHQH